jgi:hypothetical protein
VPLLDIIFDRETNKSFFAGRTSLIETRLGVRCPTAIRGVAWAQSEKESHPNQLLSVLAECSVPTSQCIGTDQSQGTVQFILDDALAQFDPRADEIEWTALAFALYLPHVWLGPTSSEHITISPI